MRVIMICGPYRAPTKAGISGNIKRARAAAIRLWQDGWAVFCPHMNTAHFDGLADDQVWLDGDMEILKRCDAAYFLKGWEESEGARNEHSVAKVLGLTIIYE